MDFRPCTRYIACVDELGAFRELLRERTQGRGAQARLAEASGISSTLIGRYRDGEVRPSDTNLKKLAPALGMAYEDLAKMCGYLPGEPRTVVDSLRQNVREHGRWARLRGLVLEERHRLWQLNPGAAEADQDGR
jgi:transcriptional regulator with XRE-family HTH domain